MFARFEIQTKSSLSCPRGEKYERNVKTDFKLKSIRVSDLYWVQSEDLTLDELASQIKIAAFDPVLHDFKTARTETPAHSLRLEKRLHLGVTDNRARTLKEALEILTGKSLSRTQIVSGTAFDLDLFEPMSEEHRNRLSQSHFYNPEIEHATWEETPIQALFWKNEKPSQFLSADAVSLLNLKNTELTQLSTDRLLSLNLEEMQAIQNHYRSLGREPTDVELEILAQTWSEHCKHKIFSAEISYEDQAGLEKIPSQIKSLFKTTIKGTTDQTPKPWLLSVFSDNAGIVAMSEDDAVCIKVETHNSPSALDPVGGAMTGIVGVNRDILGTGLGAKPVFNTNVFCVAPLDFDGPLPDRLLHPKRVLEGVRQGVEIGGNQSGIPTVNGALVFDESYLGKPLVYCGSGGILPRKVLGRDCSDKTVKPGDLVVMAGGRIGKDGIHGATFSSLELTENAPASAVQMGDPITQKRLSDFLIEARDLGLYRAVTDNGAGGLSSSVGEMATHSGGAKIDLAQAPTKYPGLVPYELVISESQERMTFAVDPKTWKGFQNLAHKRGVEVSCLGEFTEDGRFEISYGPEIVGSLSMEFLHEGVPTLKLKARWEGIKKPKPRAQHLASGIESEWKKVLSLPNIRSKEEIIRQYDHEVQGTSVIKPLSQKVTTPHRSPNDAAVLALKPGSEIGISVGCGILPEYSKYDAYTMAQASVDEAVRNLLCVGSEFSETDQTVMALIDNFCWPDPMQNTAYASDLVRACFGLKNAATELGLPFISGKDSMKNDYRGKLKGEPITISVTPTLLITALGRLPRFEKSARTSAFKNAGDRIYILGPHQMSLLGSQWARHFKTGASVLPQSDWSLARKLYSWLGSDRSHVLKSCHDVSEGGLMTTLFESSSLHQLGIQFTVSSELLSDSNFCFGEGFHTFVVSIAEKDISSTLKNWDSLGLPYLEVGRTLDEPMMLSSHFKIPLQDLNHSWGGHR